MLFLSLRIMIRYIIKRAAVDRQKHYTGTDYQTQSNPPKVSLIVAAVHTSLATKPIGLLYTIVLSASLRKQSRLDISGECRGQGTGPPNTSMTGLFKCLRTASPKGQAPHHVGTLYLLEHLQVSREEPALESSDT
ncbi:hypothetical protein CEXT_664851 [Caerostris extrusa]|uniref:Uncharacterized protein n=1 Tax=Caerostris extrusa TaxID=172846 RepID=A0AAV4MDP1_CAEEX|nr:hypothetical protein CEXT_664851 [Caerostris extrusa]